jgi:dolichol kinase
MIAIPAAGTMAGEVVRAACVAGAAIALLALTELVHRRWHPPVEWTRKMMHVGGGVLAMTFPWLFRWGLTVVVICLAMGALLAVGGRSGLLTSVTGVERRSRGEIYHPLAIALVFLLARDQPIFYVVSLWTLVVADAAAALLGRGYGRHTYAVEEERKSLEGSVVFFFVAFLGIHLPLLLFTPMSREASVVVGLQLALLVTCFEAICMRGADNLVVPLATYYLLIKLTREPTAGIVFQLAIQVALLTGALLLARSTHFLTWAGAVAAHLTLYAAFSLGGPPWAVAPALALVGFVLLERRVAPASQAGEGRHQVRGVFYVSLVPVAMIGLDSGLIEFLDPSHPLVGGHPFFVPFVAALASHLAISLLRVRRGWRGSPPATAGAADVAGLAAHIAWVTLLGFVAVVPAGLMVVPSARSAGAFLAAAGICLAAVLLYALVFRRLRPPNPDVWELRLQAAAVACAVLAWLPIHLAIQGDGP